MSYTCINARKSQIVILMADDDPDDILLVKSALQEGGLDIDLRYVEDGEEAIDYLTRRGAYANPADSPRPNLILLDLMMPKKDGLETLKEIKANNDLRSIPTVILTTSRDEEQIARSYRLGASSFVIKPIALSEMIQAMESLCSYWFQIVKLPQSISPGPGSPPSGKGKESLNRTSFPL